MTRSLRLFCCLVIFSTLGLVSTSLAATADASAATGCLQQVGTPYANGDKICIQVKNTCAEIVAVDSTIGIYNFGVQATPLSTTTDTIAIDPGQTATICVKKPTATGKYCFRFDIGNRDQGKPDDGFVTWHNNIQVAMVGGDAYGSFEVGGSEFLSEDVTLAVSSPAGWTLDLSTDFVAVSDFPAKVDYALFGPDGEEAEIVITAYSAATGEWVGDATLSVGKGDSGSTGTEPNRPPIPDGLEPGSYSETDDRSNQQVREAPLSDAQAFLEVTTGEEATAGEIALLLAWTEGPMARAVDRVLFEVEGPAGRITLAPAPGEGPAVDAGVAGAFWDTRSLPAGDYLVRARLLGVDGRQAVAEQRVTIESAPVVEISSRRSTRTLDQIQLDASVAGDRAISSWHWTFADGSTASGPAVRKTFTGDAALPFTLTVTDVEGRDTVKECEVVPYDGSSEPPHDPPGDPSDEVPVECTPKEETCGCESMEIRGAGTNSGIPHPPFAGGGTANGPVVPGFAGGPAGGTSFSYRFEVLAKLKAGSNPALCTFKQYAKRTATIGGVDHPKEHDGQEYPVDGGAYAPDGPNNGFHQSDPNGTPPTIRWVDGPGWHTIGAAPGVAIRYHAKFFAMVSGPDGTCKCSWEVDMAMNAAGAVTTAPSLLNVNCS